MRSAPGASGRRLSWTTSCKPHPGTTRLDGDTASGRAYIQELIRRRDGRSELNTPSTATSAPRTAGSLPNASTRSGTSTPRRWQARRLAQPGAR
jgi:hypothetical protein